MARYDLLTGTVSVTTNFGKNLFKKLVQVMFVAGAAGAVCIVALVALVAMIVK